MVKRCQTFLAMSNCGIGRSPAFPAHGIIDLKEPIVYEGKLTVSLLNPLVEYALSTLNSVLHHDSELIAIFHSTHCNCRLRGGTVLRKQSKLSYIISFVYVFSTEPLALNDQLIFQGKLRPSEN